MTHTLTSVLGNSQRLDGGSMYGNAPRSLWQRWTPPDDLGRINLATRALLIRESSGRSVLLETGIGAFFSPQDRDRYGVGEQHHVLIDNLAACGLAPEDIDVIVLSHLHFDHAGGLLAPWIEGETPRLAFPHSTVVVSATAWQRALNPHPRDRASFIDALPQLLLDSNRLEVVESSTSSILGAEYRLYFSDGHTPGLMMTEVEDGDGPIRFVSDMIPARPWVHVPITMGYDRFPELLIDEKHAALTDLVERQGRVFFTHDTEVAAARVTRDERGRFGCTAEQAAL